MLVSNCPKVNNCSCEVAAMYHAVYHPLCPATTAMSAVNAAWPITLTSTFSTTTTNCKCVTLCTGVHVTLLHTLKASGCNDKGYMTCQPSMWPCFLLPWKHCKMSPVCNLPHQLSLLHWTELQSLDLKIFLSRPAASNVTRTCL